MTTEPRHAPIMGSTRTQVTILCPYAPLGKPHRHTHGIGTHGKQWFAPGCGIALNPDQRAAGYTFTTEPNPHAKRKREKNDH